MDGAARIVRTGYDRLAHRYDDFAETVIPELKTRFLDMLEGQVESGTRVLELGSGTGRPVAERLTRRYDYLGVDLSPEMVAVASTNVLDARFIAADMRDLDFPAESFEAVVAFYSIIHVPRSAHASLFASIHRWLRPGGLFVACLTEGDLEAGTEDDWLGAGPMFWSGYDAATNRRLLTDAGFTLVDAGVIDQMEGDDPVAFFWVVAEK